ncbi:MAG: hypothetical protein JXB49_05340 [Bacteroidales bacterium]|nr:hypothetical protein [Bacteroidales bacterium]
MSHSETFESNVSFYGRLVDDLTREIIPYKAFQVFLKGSKKKPLYKEDGYFVFSGLKKSSDDYEFHITSNYYQTRIIKKDLTSDFIELTFDGEDELYVIIKDVPDSTGNKVTFNKITFLKSIPNESLVIGQNGFSSKLIETIEGEDVDYALLESVSGLDPGDILRFIRSNNIVMRADPYYHFKKKATLLVLKFIENNLNEIPINSVKVEIKKVNDISINNTPLGNLELKTVQFAGNTLILGNTNDITTYSNSRGDIIYYYSPDTVITKLTLSITKDGYIPITDDFIITANVRTAITIALTRN